MIEKNIRLQPHHSRDLLVGRRSDGRRPGYQPPGRGGSGGGPPSQGGGSPSGGGGGGGGGPPGGGDRQMTYTAPEPITHRDYSAERAAQAVADALNARRAAEAIARENEAREVAREKAIQVAALTPKKIEPIRHHSVDTPTQIAEQKILDDYGYQDLKARPKVPTIPKKAAGPFDYLQGPTPKTETITTHGKDDQVYTITKPKKS